MTEKILTLLFVFINSIVSATGYAGITLLMAIESACIPLPSELIMPFAGYLVYAGRMKLVWAATAGAIGCNLGSLIAYEIGCYGGRPLVERYGRWILMGRRELDLADRFFARWDTLPCSSRACCLSSGHLSPCLRESRACLACVFTCTRSWDHGRGALGWRGWE